MIASKSSRTKARKHALDILFEADLRELDPLIVLSDRVEQADPVVREFTAELVRGFAAHEYDIDDAIASVLASDWTIYRMPRVDRNLARIATFELLYTEVAHDVAIAEAVKLSGELSTDDSPAFLNGVLAAVAKIDKEKE